MTLQWKTLKQIMIVCEPALEQRILAVLAEQGAKLKTVFAVGGSGLFGDNAADVSGTLMRIECYSSETSAEAIATKLQKKFFGQYDIFLTVQDAQVLRPEKF